MGDFSKKLNKVQGLVGSFKGDKNALEGFKNVLGIGDFSNKFDQRIKDGLGDLLGGALGIRMSQIPEISKDLLETQNADRKERQKAVSNQPRKGNVPGTQVTLQYPLNYFGGVDQSGISVKNNTAVKVTKTPKGPLGRNKTRKSTSWWEGGSSNFAATTLNFPNAIHFRSLPRKEQDHSEALAKGIGNMYGLTDKKDEELYKNQDVGSWGSVNPAAEAIYDIFLHLPEKLSDEVKVEYAEAKAGGLQRFFARLFDKGGNVEELSGEGNFDMNEFLTSLKGMLPGGDIMQKAVGHMTNPAVFQALKNVNFRSYSYSFKLMPTSPAEAEVIRQIIYAFRKSMLPGTAGENNGIWTLPNEWAIKFEGPIKDWVDFPLTAVCTSATVDYGPTLMSGDSSGKGRGSPSTMTLNLNFIETMQLSRQRYGNEVGAGAYGRESLAEDGTKLGKLGDLSTKDIAAAENAIKGNTAEGGNHGTP